MPRQGGGAAGFGGQAANPFSNFIDLLLPAIQSGLKQWNIGTEPIREYFNPVYGLGQRALNTQRQIGTLLGQEIRQQGQTFSDVMAHGRPDRRQWFENLLTTAGNAWGNFAGTTPPPILGPKQRMPGPNIPFEILPNQPYQSEPAPPVMPNYSPGQASYRKGPEHKAPPGRLGTYDPAQANVFTSQLGSVSSGAAKIDPGYAPQSAAERARGMAQIERMRRLRKQWMLDHPPGKEAPRPGPGPMRF